MLNTYNKTHVVTCVASNLQKLLREKHFSVKEVAEMSNGGISYQQVLSLQAGRTFVSARTLAALCNALEIAPMELFV